MSYPKQHKSFRLMKRIDCPYKNHVTWPSKGSVC